MTISNTFKSNAFLCVQTSVLVAVIVALGCARTTTTIPAATPAAQDPPTDAEPPEPPVPPKFEVTDRVEIKTSMGTIIVGLYGKSAPETIANFLKYVDSDFYKGKVFHRVIAGFMIQGGGYDEKFSHAEPGEPIRLQLVPGLTHEPGVISMARQPNDLHSATSQFFICVASAPQLNGSYSAFGKVEAGEEVMYAISGVPTHSIETDYGKMDDVPSAPVVIESIRKLPPEMNK